MSNIETYDYQMALTELIKDWGACEPGGTDFLLHCVLDHTNFGLFYCHFHVLVNQWDSCNWLSQCSTVVSESSMRLAGCGFDLRASQNIISIFLLHVFKWSCLGADGSLSIIFKHNHTLIIYVNWWYFDTQFRWDSDMTSSKISILSFVKTLYNYWCKQHRRN